MLIHQYTWEEVFEETKHVVKVKVLSSSQFFSKVEVLESYGDPIIEKEIWINSSILTKGEAYGQTYLVFLADTIKAINRFFWEGEINEIWSKSDTSAILKAINANACYGSFGWVGAYLIEDKNISIDLTNPYVKNGKWHLLNQIESLATAIYQSDFNAARFHTEIIKKLKETNPIEDEIYYFKLLSFSKNTIWNDIFDTYEEEMNEDLQKALIHNVAGIKGEKSDAFLLRYLNSARRELKNEVVIAAINNKIELIAPQLTALIDSLIEQSEDVFTVETPEVTGEIKELLWYFNKIKYDPVIPVMHKLLLTKNEALMERAQHVLEFNKDRTYIDILYNRLKTENFSNLLICSISIRANKYNCDTLFPLLIKQCFENDPNTYTPLTAGVLFKRDRSTTVNYFKLQMKKLVQDHSHLKSYQYGQVFETNIRICLEYDVNDLHETVYNAFGEYTSYGFKYRENPHLFEDKRHLQDSLNKVIKQQLKADKIKEVDTHVFYDSLGNYEYYVTLIKKNNSTFTNRDSIVDLFHQEKQVLAQKIGIRGEKVALTTLDGEITALDNEFYHRIRKNENRVINGFYMYILTFGNRADLHFLEQLVRTESDSFAESRHFTAKNAIVELENQLKSK
ncbi:hypothetical protein [Crocinitomix catalasitica]|uniref:hypothetical protein n=1 Tax=Crocinitomix catalasitica TaxID=184607 RepID=UPI0004875397|nr:hypothetical protein [Crocinitomix catalasitica]